MAAAVEQPITSGREHSDAALSSKFAGLQPGKILEAVGALQKYVGASTSAEKVLFQEDELMYLVGATTQPVICSTVLRTWRLLHESDELASCRCAADG
jgi:hypothetical protein